MQMIKNQEINLDYLSNLSIGILYGGISNEREISLKSGEAIFSALSASGINATLIDHKDAVLKADDQLSLDIIFIALHGPGGEDGTIQDKLDELNIRYTGSRGNSSKLAISKCKSKRLWKQIGVQTADFKILNETDDWATTLEGLGGSVMVKPDSEGSSIGMTQAFNARQLAYAYKVAKQYSGTVIAESMLTGSEYTVSILSDETLPSIKIESAAKFYDFEAKYFSDNTNYICPSGLSKKREEEIQLLALRAFKSLDCEGWGRVDLMADADGAFNVLEVNTIPGMTKKSLFPKAAKAAGIEFEELVLRILDGVKQ